MGINIIRVISIALLFVACKDAPPPLSFVQFKNVLRDFHLAEAAINTPNSPYSGTSVNDTIPKLNALVLKQHHVTEAQFRSALSWYKERPEILDSAYTAVLADLSILQSNINK